MKERKKRRKERRKGSGEKRKEERKKDGSTEGRWEDGNGGGRAVMVDGVELTGPALCMEPGLTLLDHYPFYYFLTKTKGALLPGPVS